MHAARETKSMRAMWKAKIDHGSQRSTNSSTKYGSVLQKTQILNGGEKIRNKSTKDDGAGNFCCRMVYVFFSRCGGNRNWRERGARARNGEIATTDVVNKWMKRTEYNYFFPLALPLRKYRVRRGIGRLRRGVRKRTEVRRPNFQLATGWRGNEILRPTRELAPPTSGMYHIWMCSDGTAQLVSASEGVPANQTNQPNQRKRKKKTEKEGKRPKKREKGRKRKKKKEKGRKRKRKKKKETERRSKREKETKRKVTQRKGKRK